MDNVSYVMLCLLTNVTKWVSGLPEWDVADKLT